MSLSNISNIQGLIPGGIVTTTLGTSGTIGSITSSDAGIVVTNSTGPTVNLQSNALPCVTANYIQTFSGSNAAFGNGVTVTFSNVIYETNGQFIHGNPPFSAITIANTGNYRLTYTISLQDNSPTAGTTTIVTYLNQNVNFIFNSALNFSTGQNDVMTCSKTVYASLTAGDVISLGYQVYTAGSLVGTYADNSIDGNPISASLVITLIG